MSLVLGSPLGSYQVTAKIGEGGMGEVYQARDTKLDRDVALKVLPEAFTSDPDRLARFEREAKVLASLNHPNIGSIYGLEEAEGVKALVLELIEGPTLADRIKQGPIPVDEALPIAKQIAEALEAAHEQGVIHRDLKPANVKVKADGTVKVLDFGLAKAMQPDASGPNMSLSPTISLTAAATQMGMVIGTAAYMAPEQAKGRVVDKRADVWAFGAVLYEMLAQQKPFAGDDVSTTLARVIEREPDWGALPRNLPPVLATYLRRCLAKEPKQRIHDIADVRLAMDGAFEIAVATDHVAPNTQSTTWKEHLRLALAGIALMVVGGLAAWGLVAKPTPAAGDVTRFSIEVPSLEQAFTIPLVALSPDGNQVAYAAGGQLYLRTMDQLEGIPLPGTEGGLTPFFSPGGEWIAFWANNELKKVQVSGGLPVTLARGTVSYGGSWAADDTILFNESGTGIFRVAASGGAPEIVVPVGPNEANLGGGQLLPGGEWVLFWVYPSRQISVQSLLTGERRVLIEDGGQVKYLETGHLVYVRAGTLLAVSFDVEQLAVVSGPLPLLEGITEAGNFVAQVALSDSGSLVYVPVGNGARTLTLVWVDRQGRDEPVLAEAGDYMTVDVSPDGQRLAYGSAGDIWTYDLVRETATPLTFHPGFDSRPRWSPDGRRVAFTSYRDGANGNLFWTASDGTGGVARLTTNRRTQTVTSWLSDESRVLFHECDVGCDLGQLSMEGDPTPELFLETEFDERNAMLSPDGGWIAYESDLSGTFEVYVSPFPDADAPRQRVSIEGGREPQWGSDGRELFYWSAAGLMVVAIETQPIFRPAAPRELFDLAAYQSSDDQGQGYAVAPDSQRFLMLKRNRENDDSSTAQLIIVRNWAQELLARFPRP